MSERKDSKSSTPEYSLIEDLAILVGVIAFSTVALMIITGK